jgi:hypothetical protein
MGEDAGIRNCGRRNILHSAWNIASDDGVFILCGADKFVSKVAVVMEASFGRGSRHRLVEGSNTEVEQ